MFITGLFLLFLSSQVPAAAQPPAPAAAANPVVILDTSAGAITIELFADKAPDSVQNFLEYVRDGFYSGTIFHRVVPGYVIQGGGYTPELVEKSTRPPVRNEATNGLSNARGTVAMARMSAVRSATSQFFINLANNARLDHRGFAPDDYGYAVFGRVIAGMDVVDRIAAMPTASREGMDDVPVAPVVIKSATLRPGAAR
ncbi:MAG TPA: peptidylprolyl isomerase [Vicinamibacterales bacterium]|jgi:peptidyl-prolyl cis-trans isomerase A (cyclophilin A)|nr:peptidylprolyl isomerase [Vicinamibacterales bacterium]